MVQQLPDGREADDASADEGSQTESFGTWLRRQREMREISLREIADESKVGIRYLQALESDRFDVLPAPVFTKGFLRQYAGYVGLDSEEVINFFLLAVSENEDDEEPDAEQAPRPRSSAGPPKWAVWGLVLAVVLLVGASAVLWWMSTGQVESAPATPPPTAAPVPPPAPEVVPLPPPVTPDTVDVMLEFEGACWVEADVDGERAVAETRVQGESLRLEAEQEVRLKLGDPSVVRVEVNNVPFTLPGDPGEVVRDLVIDRDTVAMLTEGG